MTQYDSTSTTWHLITWAVRVSLLCIQQNRAADPHFLHFVQGLWKRSWCQDNRIITCFVKGRDLDWRPLRLSLRIVSYLPRSSFFPHLCLVYSWLSAYIWATFRARVIETWSLLNGCKDDFSAIKWGLRVSSSCTILCHSTRTTSTAAATAEPQPQFSDPFKLKPHVLARDMWRVLTPGSHGSTPVTVAAHFKSLEGRKPSLLVHLACLTYHL